MYDMSYIEKNLMSGESVVYRSKLHWIVFCWPALLFIAAIILVIIGGSALGIGLAFFLFAILAGINSLISYLSSEFGVTNKRVIVKVGFIRRNSLEILLNKVEGIKVNQGVIGRVLDYGSIVIVGTGGTHDPLHNIREPLEFRRKAQEQIEGKLVPSVE
jgi:uncharacterized membrane protein YdbT with pleckstrin-like domain